MATYSKETALYDTGAIGDDIQEAGTKATNFLSVDNSGIMVYDGSGGAQTPTSPSTNTRNVFIDSNSVDVRKGATVLASFGTETVINTTDGTELAHFGYDETQGESSTTIAPYYTLGLRNTTTTAYSSSSTYNVGDLCIYNNKLYICTTKISTAEAWNSSHWHLAIGKYSVAEGLYTSSSSYYTHSEGYLTKAIGSYSHTEGRSTLAYGSSSHAEGSYTTANGEGSHAEGSYTIANGAGSHAEGAETTASGQDSHAEGVGSVASYACHAQNIRTIAKKTASTAIGTYNIEDTSANKHPSGTTGYGSYALIIGNGTAENARSNALTVDWTGNVETAGAVYDESGYYANGALLGSCMTLVGESNATVTLSTSYKYPALSVVKESFGNAFVKSSDYNGIECQYAGLIMLQASFRVYNNFTASDIINYGIYNNTKSEECTGGRFRVPANMTAPNQDAHTRTCFVRVSAGDVIRARIQNSTGSRGVVQIDNTFLTACYIGAITA